MWSVGLVKAETNMNGLWDLMVKIYETTRAFDILDH